MAPHDFCEDYVFDWAICYAMGALHLDNIDVDKYGVLVSLDFIIIAICPG